MASYKMDMLAYPRVHEEWGTKENQAYLLCLECGQFWGDIQRRAHLIRADHDPVCPAMLWQRERYKQSRSEGPVTYSTVDIHALP